MNPVKNMRREDMGLQWLVIGLFICFVVLAGRLWYVQIVSFKKYEKYREVQSYRTVRIPAPRGLIFDRNSQSLADNEPQLNIVVYLDQLRKDFTRTYNELKGDQELSYLEGLKLQKDARYLTVSNMVYEASLIIGNPSALVRSEFESHYYRHRYMAMPVLTGLSREQMARFMEQGSRLKGFDLEVRSKRRYPNGSLAAHVLGYMRPRKRSSNEQSVTLEMSFDYELPDFMGKSGLEGQYEDELSGEPGAKSILVNNMIYRQEEEEWLPFLPGKNLYLTLDTVIQKAAEDALQYLNPHQLRKGAIVVMDCTNGDVLALASAPAFDPNIFTGFLPASVFNPMIDPKGTLPLFNRATYGRYHPGSIFKIMVGLAGLETGIIDPAEEFYGEGYYPLGGRRIDDTAGAGYFDFDKAFYKSSNAYFIHYGLELGPETIVDYGNQIFLGKETGLLPSQETGGYFPTKEAVGNGWHPGDTANLSIGQGKIDVTPLQMAVMTSAAANGGTVFWPRIVAGWESTLPNGDSVFETEPAGRVRGKLKVSPSNIKILQDAMLADVEESTGSGSICRIPGYLIAGKTGTAETGFRINGRRIKHTWFVAYAPFQNPRYAVAVFVDDGTSGRTSCAPLAKIVFNALRDLPNPSRIKPRKRVFTLEDNERSL
jgi:penicillin-binding protein 2